MALNVAGKTKVRLDKQGRFIIPAEVRRELGFKPGKPLILRVEDGELRIRSLDESIRRLQDYMKTLTGGRPGVVDEVIADRRREAERE